MINLDPFPPGTWVIVRVEYPAEGCQLRITDVDERRVTAFITDSAGQPQVLVLCHPGQGPVRTANRDAKDLGFLAVPHHSFATNRIWMHAVFIAGPCPHGPGCWVPSQLNWQRRRGGRGTCDDPPTGPRV